MNPFSLGSSQACSQPRQGSPEFSALSPRYLHFQVPPACHMRLSLAGPHHFCSPCLILCSHSLRSQKLAHLHPLHSPEHSGSYMLPSDQVEQRTWLPSLSALPTAGAEASPDKCHQVLPLLKTLRVPHCSKIPAPRDLLLQPHRWFLCTTLPAFTSGSWACGFPTPFLPRLEGPPQP